MTVFSLKERARRTIDAYGMLQENDKIVIGVSGGSDSVALLHILFELEKEHRFSLAVAHVNHCFRGDESDRDEAFVKNKSTQLGIPYFCERADVYGLAKKNRISKQVAGRKIRYAFFEQVAKCIGATKIALAHTLDDQAETILMRILRGAGIHGLSGIPPFRGGRIIRPLLQIKKSNLLEYLKTNGFEYREDSSNKENIYTRNKIRHELIPVLTDEYNPNIANVLVNLGDTAKNDEDLLKSVTTKTMDELSTCTKSTVELEIKRILKLHVGLQHRVLRESVKRIKGDLRQIGFIHTKKIVELITNGKTGKLIHLPGGIRVLNNYEQLVIHKKSTPAEDCFSYSAPLQGEIFVSESLQKLSFNIVTVNDAKTIEPGPLVELFDFDSIKQPLTIRSRKKGDILRPSGINGKKKLKKYFIDLKIPKEKRERIPLLVSGENILWVVGLRRSSLAKVTQDTKKILSVRVTHSTY